MAESQFAGRGQQDSQWHSEPGKNLTFSLLLNPTFLAIAEQFDLTRADGGKAVFDTKIQSDRSGTFNYGIRIYPKHEFLPHRQDFGLLKWI